jgi:hypothetical protein
MSRVGSVIIWPPGSGFQDYGSMDPDPKEKITDPHDWLLEGEAHRFDEAGDESTEGGDLVLQVSAVLR